MRRVSFFSLLVFALIGGCATSMPDNDILICGPPVEPETVVVVDAEEFAADRNIAAIEKKARKEAGPYRLVSRSPIRSSTFPYVEDKPRWIHAQESAASNGCDILILVESKMEKLIGDTKPSLYMYFLMGRRLPGE